MLSATDVITSLLVGATLVSGQAGFGLPASQNTAWNSSFQLSSEQLELANITPDFGEALNRIINFDRSQLANGGPGQDKFYSLHDGSSSSHFTIPTKPGQLIKLEEVTDTTNWSIPAMTAMSRIIYSTTNINGTLIPASAYILWPYTPKPFNKNEKASSSSSNTAAPVVLWTHGTSGFYADGAPSAHRSLFYGNIVPYTLAQAGYAVVAPDYAGLGVNTSWDRSYIPHQYLIHQAGAADALNAMRAALQAFPARLTRDYVVMGHSQGGGVSWGVSELLADRKLGYGDLTQGHLGTISAAPASRWSEIIAPELFLTWIGKDLDKIYPEFKLSDWLTPLGINRTKLLNQVQGSQMLTTYLMQPGSATVQPDWNNTIWSKSWVPQLLEAGHKPFKGPMLITQGTADPGVPYKTTSEAVDDLCAKYPGDLELLFVEGAGHFPHIQAARQEWLAWIEDRFERRALARRGCWKSELKPFWPIENYQVEEYSFQQWAGGPQWIYELPTES